MNEAFVKWWDSPGEYRRTVCSRMHTAWTGWKAGQKAATPQWEDIESAPKDGVLIWLGNASGVWVGYYLRLYQSGYQPKNPWSSMMLHHEHMKVVDLTPTHWQPLPEPPKQ